MIRILFLFSVLACGARMDVASGGECEGYPILPEGTPSDFIRRPVLGGVVVAAPEHCGDEAFVALDRAAGRAPLQMGIDTCEPEPAECSGVGAETMLVAAMNQLQAEGIEAHTVGLGVCGDIGGDYEAWDYSLSVNRWQDVNRAVEVVAALMNEQNVRGHAGVSVRSHHCVTLQ